MCIEEINNNTRRYNRKWRRHLLQQSSSRLLDCWRDNPLKIRRRRCWRLAPSIQPLFTISFTLSRKSHVEVVHKSFEQRAPYFPSPTSIGGTSFAYSLRRRPRDGITARIPALSDVSDVPSSGLPNVSSRLSTWGQLRRFSTNFIVIAVFFSFFFFI